MEENEIENPFIKLCWQEQKKLAQGNSLAIRYHPMIIRFCISLASKSPSAYDGLLTLPSRRTLRDFNPNPNPNPNPIQSFLIKNK